MIHAASTTYNPLSERFSYCFPMSREDNTPEVYCNEVLLKQYLSDLNFIGEYC